MRFSLSRTRDVLGGETLGLLVLMVIIIAAFSLATPKFLTEANFASMGFQAPLLGLLTIAMLAPMISGGFNLAIIFIANFSGLTFAWFMLRAGGPDAGVMAAIVMGVVAALLVGALAGAIEGAVVAYVGAHPILVSLAMMIFSARAWGVPDQGRRYLGLSRNHRAARPWHRAGRADAADRVSPSWPVGWHILLRRSRHGFAVYMVGLEHTRGGICRHQHQAHPRRDLRPVGCRLRPGRHSDAGPLQLGARRARRSAAAGDGAGDLPRRHRPVSAVTARSCR